METLFLPGAVRLLLCSPKFDDRGLCLWCHVEFATMKFLLGCDVLRNCVDRFNCCDCQDAYLGAVCLRLI
jgi:hypothetical protein